MKRRQFAAGKVVFREGDIGHTFFQIVEGTAGVYLHYGEADQRKLNELKAGQYFGEMAVIEIWPRSATVVADYEADRGKDPYADRGIRRGVRLPEGEGDRRKE